MSRYNLFAIAFFLIVSGVLAGEKPDARVAPIDKGRQLMKKTKYVEAVAQFEEELRLRPHNLDALVHLVECMEKLEREDEAMGYWLCLYNRTESAPREDKEARKLNREARLHLRPFKEIERAIENAQRDFARGCGRVLREAEREKQIEVVADITRTLLRIDPQDRTARNALESYRELVAERDHVPYPEAPRGYETIFNQHDFGEWQGVTGNWEIRDGLLIGHWGTIRWPHRYERFHLRMEYYTSTPNTEDHHNSVTIHRDGQRWSGANIMITGPQAGLANVNHVPPDRSLVHVIEAAKERDPDIGELKKPTSYREGAWNVIEISVNRTYIEVFINDEPVYRSVKGGKIRGYDGRHGTTFPGMIYINARRDLQMRNIYLKN